MNSILDHHVPRELVDSIFPESDIPRLEVEELGGRKLVGSLDNVPRYELDVLVHRLRDHGLKYHIIDSEDRVDVLYFSELSEEAQDAIRLKMRDLGHEDPPLTIAEHMRLSGHYGIPITQQNQLRDVMHMALREAGLVDRPIVMVTPQTLMVVPPTNLAQDFRGVASEWAEANSEDFGFEVVTEMCSPMRAAVRPSDPEKFDDLKAKLTEANIEFDEVEPVEESPLLGPDGEPDWDLHNKEQKLQAEEAEAEEVAQALMGGQSRLDTSWGSKSVEGVKDMLLGAKSPEEVAKVEGSYTGQFLGQVLLRRSS